MADRYTGAVTCVPVSVLAAGKFPNLPYNEEQMEIRTGTLADLNVCLAMDTSFETEYVWQMEERNSSGDIAIGFHLTRLPRPMKVTGVVSPDDVSHNFMNGGALFVAEEGGQLCGFVDVTASEWNQVAVINNLAVAPVYRGRGIGSRLLRGGARLGTPKETPGCVARYADESVPRDLSLSKTWLCFLRFQRSAGPEPRDRDVSRVESAVGGKWWQSESDYSPAAVTRRDKMCV